jgi:hypothetical protein
LCFIFIFTFHREDSLSKEVDEIIDEINAESPQGKRGAATAPHIVETL